MLLPANHEIRTMLKAIPENWVYYGRILPWLVESEGEPTRLKISPRCIIQLQERCQERWEENGNRRRSCLRWCLMNNWGPIWPRCYKIGHLYIVADSMCVTICQIHIQCALTRQATRVIILSASRPILKASQIAVKGNSSNFNSHNTQTDHWHTYI